MKQAFKWRLVREANGAVFLCDAAGGRSQLIYLMKHDDGYTIATAKHPNWHSFLSFGVVDDSGLIPMPDLPC